MNKFWNERIRGLEPYTPGEQPKDRRYVKLNTNENPYPPSPKVLEAIGAALGDERRRAPLVPHDATFLNLDLRQSGFGDFNKNVLPMEKYRFDVQHEKWTVELKVEK